MCTKLPREVTLHHRRNEVPSQLSYSDHWRVLLIHSRSPEKKENKMIKMHPKKKEKKTSNCCDKHCSCTHSDISILFFQHNTHSWCPSNCNNSKYSGLLKTSENNPNYGFTAPLSSVTESQSVKYFIVRAETPQRQATGDFEDTKSVSEGFKREFPLGFAAQDCHSMAA